MAKRVLQESIKIRASATIVDHCVTDLELMSQWLNPWLKCQPIGKWDTQVGSRSRFVIQFPLIQPTLRHKVVKREPGLIEWDFAGFLGGSDRWECRPINRGTLLINRLELRTSNPLIAWGWPQVAARWATDMQVQLSRIKQIAEQLYEASGWW